MIIIRNEQRLFKINRERMAGQVEVMLKELDYANYDIGFLLVNETRMRSYNKEYRDIDKPTDILSFPFHPKLIAGERIVVVHEEDKNLGDIIICPALVQRDAVALWERSFDDHLTALLAHGIAHLLNYDHHTDEQFSIMDTIEQRLRSAATHYITSVYEKKDNA